MHVWRICAESHVASGLQGAGGLYVSGRWHHRGRPVVYTSATPSLAALEVLVHLDPALGPGNLRLVEIEVPNDVVIETCDPKSLAADWDRFPAPSALQDYGSAWLASRRSAVLCVPSAVLAIEQNFIINPLHPDVSLIRTIRDLPFSFDLRLM